MREGGVGEIGLNGLLTGCVASRPVWDFLLVVNRASMPV